MKNVLAFDISKLLDKTTGTSDNYSFEGHMDLEGLKLKTPLRGRVEIMRIEEGFNVKAIDVTTKVELLCDKCLSHYAQPVKVEDTERIFFLNRPPKAEDAADLFMVDKKHLSVDVSELLRQEIILHFPISSVCSKSCKGLCEFCGKNKNKSKCTCREVSTAYKPLAKLKELLK